MTAAYALPALAMSVLPVCLVSAEALYDAAINGMRIAMARLDDTRIKCLADDAEEREPPTFSRAASTALAEMTAAAITINLAVARLVEIALRRVLKAGDALFLPSLSMM